MDKAAAQKILEPYADDGHTAIGSFVLSGYALTEFFRELNQIRWSLFHKPGKASDLVEEVWEWAKHQYSGGYDLWVTDTGGNRRAR